MSSRKVALACGLLLAGVASANDGVAQFGAGGIVLLGKEPRVAMVRERLTVSLSQVAVEYEFLNESRAELVTEVAFPIPPFGIEQATRWVDAPPDEARAFDVGFAGTADGKPILPKRQVRAFAGDLDVTETLEALGIDFQRFGGHDAHDGEGYQVRKLPEAQRERLRQLGAVQRDQEDWPLWKVAITYHWTQRFPAGKVVWVRHAYRPVIGNSNTIGASPEAFAAEVPGACLDAATAARLRREGAHRGWLAVDYILTTANTWKTPIRDFELVVERAPSVAVSFCWDGKVVRDGGSRLRARKKDFRPERELTIYFIPTGRPPGF